ncbi:flagellar hook assembly protein FlgD [Phreatobacter sp.]|uniref:flagellar hook assembly protein FlgD n=1 Tax=Phreatobacter sp. TaxID=1966341 RepID=UPI003F717EDF
MTTVAAATANNTATSATATSQARLSQNFDTFLQLLTTQLRNQDPTQPMDANQFTQQLVQYSQVEQQLSTNSKLDQLLSSFQTNQTTTALGYLGTTVRYDSSVVVPGSTGASWNLTVPESGAYTVRIRDQNGNLVKETAADFTAGSQQQFNWDGKRSDGQPLGTGAYTMELFRSNGTEVAQLAVTNTGQVTSVDTSTGSPRVTVGGQVIPVSRILSVSI